jgi:hypothetical protein
MKLTVTNRIIVHRISETFKVVVKELLTFPHVGVLRASANLEKRILCYQSKKGTHTPEKDGPGTSLKLLLYTHSSQNFSKYFFQLIFPLKIGKKI